MVLKSVITDVPPCPRDGAPTRMTLLARKTVRDKFDAQKEDFEKFLSDTLKEEWKIFVDAPNVFTYTKEEHSSRDDFGGYLYSYLDYNKNALLDFIRGFGDDGRQQINKLAYAHLLTIEPEKPDGWELGGADFKDGKLRLLFDPENFGVNPNYCLGYYFKEVVAKWEKKMESTGPAKLSLAARKDIRDRYEAEVPKILERAQKYLKLPDLAFEPNFESNYSIMAAWEQELRDSPDENDIYQIDRDWQANIGGSVLSYFKDFVEYLRNQNFHKDDMLQEGFAEAVEKHKVAVRIVDAKIIKKQSGEYDFNNAIIEEGVLVLQTNRDYFGKNTQYSVQKILKIL